MRTAGDLGWAKVTTTVISVSVRLDRGVPCPVSVLVYTSKYVRVRFIATCTRIACTRCGLAFSFLLEAYCLA